MATPELISGYDRAVLSVRARVLAYAQFLWTNSPSLRDEDVERLVARIVPVVRSGQLQVAQLTDAYIGRLSQSAGISWSAGVDRALVDYRGVPDDVVYKRPAVTTYTALTGGSTFAVAKKAGLARLSSIVSTDIQQTRNRQAQQSMSRSGFEWYRRELSGKENCALCSIASSQRYHTGNLMPIHPGCVPGDSVVSTVPGGSTHLADFAWGEVEAVSRRLFEGELIEFITASGDEVRVTSNHPVLTDKGWVPAHLLGEGDTVFSGSTRERVVLGGPNVDERPALIEDVFDAARVAFSLVRMPLAAEDFHADGANGEVEIVYTHGHFPTPRSSEGVEESGECRFVHRHGRGFDLDGGGALGSLFPRGLASLAGDVGSRGLGGDLFGAHLGGAELSGTAAVTRFDAPAGEFTLESAPIYASQGKGLVSRLAGDVEGDSIVELHRVSWSGHVFNLHTREGWYSSNNHIVSNCDCGVVAIKSPNDPGQVIDGERLETVHAEVERFVGEADRGGRAPDYRKLIVSREHGELGETLTWLDDDFTGPNDLGRPAVM